jgi:hypothetical protein
MLKLRLLKSLRLKLFLKKNNDMTGLNAPSIIFYFEIDIIYMDKIYIDYQLSFCRYLVKYGNVL